MDLRKILINIAALILSIISHASSQLDFGEAGPPDYTEVPKGLSFTCKDRIPGYYADVSARCQVWHWCVPSGAKYSFVCPPGTVFNQNFRVCDWWFNVDCASAESRYNVNEDLYRKPDGTLI